MEAQIAQLSPLDAAGFQRFLNENRVKLLQMESCLESPFLGWRDIFNARLTHVTISCLDLLYALEAWSDASARGDGQRRFRGGCANRLKTGPRNKGLYKIITMIARRRSTSLALRSEPGTSRRKGRELWRRCRSR